MQPESRVHSTKSVFVTSTCSKDPTCQNEEDLIDEVNAYRALQEYDISFGASPAGASDRPDLEIKKDKKNLKTTGSS